MLVGTKTHHKVAVSINSVFFSKVSVAQVFESDGAPRYYNVEKLLPDYSNFKKWNPNFGAVNDDEQLIQAFSHWTHDITGNEGFSYELSSMFVIPQMASWWLLTCKG